MEARQRCRALALLGLVLTIAISTAAGAPYWGPGDPAVRCFRSPAHASDAGRRAAAPRWNRIEPEECREAFARIAAYLEFWQVRTPEDPQYGGVREGEHLAEIVQTDNTSQAIWVWSRYATLTGDSEYLTNILDAFAYSMRYPAYLEEGGDSPQLGYYRMYNCAWALAAEGAYQEAFGDGTYRAYADSCARYIRDHALVRFGTGFYAYVNPPVYAWALGNLYAAGARGGDLDWVGAAVTKSDTVRQWVEEEPALLSDETWAMSGGATIWGLLASYFRAHPDEAGDWLGAYADQLAAGADPGAYQNGWDAWYALGHWAVAEAWEATEHYDLHADLTAALIAEDGDLDGGIPGCREDSDDMDQSWVSSALAFAGCNPLLPPVARADDETLSPASARSRATLALACGPCPAQGRLELTFRLPAREEISLTVHDAAGRRLTRLVSGLLPAGTHAVSWNGRDCWGRRLPGGTYWMRLSAGERAVSHSVVWMD